MRYSRRALLRRAGVGVAVAAGSVALAEPEADAATLDAAFTTPFSPRLSFRYPSSLYVYVNRMTEVEDNHVIVSNRALPPLRDVGGLPDMRDAPSDAAVLTIFSQTLEAGHDTSTATPLVDKMSMAALGDGERDDTPGVRRRYSGWFVNGQASFPVYLLHGPDVSGDWNAIKAVVASARMVD